MRWWVWIGRVGFVLVIGATAWWCWHLTRLDQTEQATAITTQQAVVAAVGTIGAIASLFPKLFARAVLPPLETRADNLANALLPQWRRAIEERNLNAPLPIRWRRATRPVAAPVTDPATAGFPPLPGAVSVAAHELKTGTQDDLFALYAGLPSGRLIITGSAGAGKSAAAVLLMRDALEIRQGASPEDRASMPVPILVNPHGWDPRTTSVESWLTGQVAEISGSRRGSAELVTQRKIAVFLDGLDEVGKDLRPELLRALSHKTGFRLVLLSRDDELVHTAQRHVLLGATAVALRPVDGGEAADYLLSRLVSPAPPAWQKLSDQLRKGGRSPLADVLRTPFMLTLLRDAYDATGPVDELLNHRRFRKAAHIEHHLLDRALEAAYTPGPDRPPQRYSLATAQRTLDFLAHYLSHKDGGDLKWWKFARLTVPSAVAMTLLTWAAWAAVAIPYKLLAGLPYRLADGLLAILPVGLNLGAVSAYLAAKNWAPPPRRVPRFWWRVPFTGSSLLFALPLGLGMALVFKLFGTTLPGLAGWLVTGLALWLTAAFGGMLIATTQDDDYAFDPPQSWRDDAVASLILAIASALGGFVMGTGFGMQFRVSLVNVLAIGAIGGLTATLWVWPLSSTGRLLCHQVELRLRYRTPLRLMRFLEDARQRQVLRTAGPVYQFRHAKLQERLNERWLESRRSVPGNN
ncbi:hypothetical protein [Micromonospora carbonacea]|uniref:NACHT domain-containing protein n=1 Tax=Micromonospora carbonacea TaxID=47853 RepID=A0A7H8XP28_9ACTN|nr:hypothetical protein [Micromonospora carbonacea]MBB5825425.1 hypothetical protein [Micromonospora carbonacea]QLD26524.1 hypothetical protein HXZ27_21810 [Micromonospora carbonacea]